MEHRAKVGSFGEWSMFCQNSFSSFLWNVPVSLASENLEKFWFSNIFRVGRKGYCEKKKVKEHSLRCTQKIFSVLTFVVFWSETSMAENIFNEKNVSKVL